ncbi:hypothetical protein L7F22_021506 [Adiantum nelumboides]|nr:hypothetical protein [Adiantum nelumboides]
MYDETVEWLDKDDENTMFLPTVLEKSITPWECTHCPWCLEYSLGVIPKSKKELHEREKYIPHVDVLLVDVLIEDFAWHSMEMWFKNTPIYDGREYCLKGEVSQYVAKLIFADFSTSMMVESIQKLDTATDDVVPKWNQFSIALACGHCGYTSCGRGLFGYSFSCPALGGYCSAGSKIRLATVAFLDFGL